MVESGTYEFLDPNTSLNTQSIEKKYILCDIRSTPIFATSVTRVVHTCCFRNTTEEELFTAYEQQPREVCHTCGQEGHFVHTYSRDIPNDVV